MKTIPIVVHVVYNTPEQNISEAQIQSQIKILNQDFSRTNPDRVNTPAAFKDVAADTGIQFCLVKVIRKQTSVTEFNDNDDVKACSTGGSAAIDTTKYMNVWVCNLGSRLLGYAEFPNTAVSPTYGVVVNYASFGNTGAVKSPYNLGRTLTHELSHCLGVCHTFNESSPASCTKTDHCYDIPSQSSPTSGCPAFPSLDDCAISSPGTMFMNYMDYSNDSCMNIFTKDQANRMNAVLNIAPYDKLGSGSCVGLTSDYNCSGTSIGNNAGTGFTQVLTDTANSGIAAVNRNKYLSIFIFISLVAIYFLWKSKLKQKMKLIYTGVYALAAIVIYYQVAKAAQ